MHWYVKVIPVDETQAPIDAEYMWGPFSTRRDAYAADRIFLDNEFLGLHLFSAVYFEDPNTGLTPDVQMLSDPSKPMDLDQKCSCGGDLRPAGKTMRDGSPVYRCQACPMLWGYVRERFRCVGIQGQW
ncbi:MAG: hypothetical protein V3S37_02200 [Dehalococcoidia bacterium]